MADNTHLLLRSNLKQLRLPAMGAAFEKLAREAAAANEGYERRSLLVTSNLAFGEWGQVFQGERMTAALLDRLTHRCHIFEMNSESFRFRESMKSKKAKKGE